MTKEELKGAVIVKPNEGSSNSYLSKATLDFQSAELLMNKGLYENSASHSYSSMLDHIHAVLFRIGLKVTDPENALKLFDKFFLRKDLTSMIKEAKKRVEELQELNLHPNEMKKEITEKIFRDAEEVGMGVDFIIHNLSNEDIQNIKNKIDRMIAR